MGRTSNVVRETGDVGARVPVVQRQARGDATSVSLDLSRMPPPDYSLPIDCGTARLRHGSPELVCAQLNPFDESSIIRLLVVRYSKERFLERAVDNVKLLPQLEELLSVRSERGTVGMFESMFREAKPSGDCSVAIVDAEFETVAYAGGRGGISFYTAPTFDMHKLIRGTADTATITSPVQITMSMPALADLLLAWGRLAAEVAS